VSFYLCCEVCDATKPHWTIMRTGDVATTWACDVHLAVICERLQRHDEITELTIRDSRKLREWVSIRDTLDKIAKETP